MFTFTKVIALSGNEIGLKVCLLQRNAVYSGNYWPLSKTLHGNVTSLILETLWTRFFILCFLVLNARFKAEAVFLIMNEIWQQQLVVNGCHGRFPSIP